jgi:hypothetical protein
MSGRDERLQTWKPVLKKLIGRPNRRWDQNIKMDHKKSGRRLDSSGLGQSLAVGSCENFIMLRVP